MSAYFGALFPSSPVFEKSSMTRSAETAAGGVEVCGLDNGVGAGRAGVGAEAVAGVAAGASGLGFGFDGRDFSLTAWAPALTVMFRHLSYEIKQQLHRIHITCDSKQTIHNSSMKGRRMGTLRSMLEREKRKGLNSGSLWMFFHLPVPCLATPALSASSSSDVHFCFGFPISFFSLPLLVS